MIKIFNILGLRLSWLLMALAIVVALAVRLYKIDVIPYGYHVDELASSVTVECLATEGVDAHNNRYPLFGQTNYGTPKPATYMYPAILWGKAFSFSVPSLRSFSVWGHFLGIAGLFFLGRVLFGNAYGLWAAFLGAISPWVWTSSRVAFESLLAPTFFIWGLFFFFRRSTYFHWAMAGLLFAAAMYSYPPMRLQVPLLFITLVGYASFKKTKAPFLLWLVIIACLALPVIPLVMKTLSGELQQRFNSISIVAPAYLTNIGKTNSIHDLWGIFLSNYQLHLTSDFLLFKGDPSLIHSVGHFGILDWLDVGALILCLFWALLFWIQPLRKYNPWQGQSLFLLFLLVNIFLGIVPAALTNSEIPNSLRIVGSWPFMCLLGAYFMHHLQRWFWPLGLIAVIVGIMFFSAFAKTYFTVYREESKGMFSYWANDQVAAAKTEEDWRNFMLAYSTQDYHFRYFLMHYRSDKCTSTRLKWERQRDLLQSLHLYY